MATMSDSQFEFEYNEDFYDDVSDDDNNLNDSGMDEKALGHNSYDADTDIQRTEPKAISSQTPPSHAKKSNGKLDGSKKKTPLRSSDPYKSYMTPAFRRTHGDVYGKKTKKSHGNKGSSAGPMMVNNSTHNTVIKRVLSASRKKTTTLNNVIHELQQQCATLTIENRDLKRNARVQDRDLRKLDGAEAQLPALMKKHSDEVIMLQEKYKRQKEISISLTENIKRVDIELLKTKDKLKEYQSIIKDKNLGERVELRNNILNLQKVIEEKDCKISELNRNIALQKKSHTRVMKERNEKYEKAMEKVKVLEGLQTELVSRIKDLEKSLEATYIYSHRKQKDGKQMIMFSSQDPVAPLLKESLEESQLIQTSEEKSLLTETIEEDVYSAKSLVGERIDTMVSRNDNEQGDLNASTEEVTTFLTEGKSKTEESEDFYNVNDGKEISIIKKDNNIYPLIKEKSSTTTSEIDSLGDDELHEKLDQMDEKRDETETVELMIKDKDEEDIKGIEVSNDADGKKEETLQVELERSIEKMEIIEKDYVRVNDEAGEEAKARKLLLAKIQAIDNGENPNNITESSLNMSDKKNERKSKLNKKPIFLESTLKSSTDTSHKNPATKPLDLLSNSNTKSNSGNSKPHRNRHLPDPSSGNEEESSTKMRETKDSWEFKKTDDNLHKGLPSHTSVLLSPQTSRSNALPNNFNSNKNRINARRYDDDYNSHSHHDTSYSPTALDINTGTNKRTSKIDGGNLFDQFEDPFKNETASPKQGTIKNVSPGNLPVRKKDKPAELFSRMNKNSQIPDPMVMDDLEEMFII